MIEKLDKDKYVLLKEILEKQQIYHSKLDVVNSEKFLEYKIETFISDIQDKNNLAYEVFVLKDNSNIVGFCAGVVFKDSTGKVYDLYIDESYRGDGNRY